MTRYAIYFVPDPDEPLAIFGARALGYDVSSAGPIAFHDHQGFRALDPASFTSSPARYGFHATLRAPFELAEGQDETGLMNAVDSLAGRLPPVDLGHLAVSEIGRFIALTPKGLTAAIDRLAQSCVSALEPFRAPLSEADLNRRLSAPLTPRQTDYVERFGYPYVFEEFRFHMTLTGSIADLSRRTDVRKALAELYAPIDRPHRVEALTLCRQLDRNAKFHVLSRHRLLSGG